MSTIVIGSGSTLADAVRSALPVKDGVGDVLVLPSTLRRSDRVASAVRDVLRDRRVPSHVILPVNPIAELTRLGTKTSGSSWTTVAINPPDGAQRSIRLPDRLFGGGPLWTVTDVDAVSGSGPFVLDLLAMYLHPLSRLRNLATRARADAAVDANMAVSISLSVIGKDSGGVAIAAVTRDPVAAELFALALADENLPADRTVTGPWEDRVIQRATELELGARIPRDLSLVFLGTPNQSIRETIERISRRIGVATASDMNSPPHGTGQ